MKIIYNTNTQRILRYGDDEIAWDIDDEAELEWDGPAPEPVKDYYILGSQVIKRNLGNSEVNKKWDSIKRERDELLKDSDWRDLPSYPGGDKELWQEYRQALRDIPQNHGNPDEVVWPLPPK